MKYTEAWNAIGLDAVDPSIAFHSGPFEAACSISPRTGLP